MKTSALLLYTLAIGSSCAFAHDVAVQRTGNGSTPLSNGAFDTAILTFSGPVSTGTFSLPTSGTARSTDSGTATSNGYFNFFNHRYTIGGYDAAVGTASVASTNTKTVSLYTPSFSLIENIDAPTGGQSGNPPSPWAGNNFRSAITENGVDIFGSGTSSGSPNTGGIWHYSTTSGTWTRVSSTVTNTRNIEIYGNDLYFSTGAGTNGIYSLGSVASLDLSGADLNTASLVFSLSSPYGFYIDQSNGVAFAASDSGGAGGGIFRFDYDTNTSSWNQTWSFRLDMSGSTFTSAAASGTITTARGLSAVFDSLSSTYTVYATSSEVSDNRLISFTDGLTSSIVDGSTFTQVAQAGTNYVFRGVDVVPEPSAALAVLTGFGMIALRRSRRASLKA